MKKTFILMIGALSLTLLLAVALIAVWPYWWGQHPEPPVSQPQVLGADTGVADVPFTVDRAGQQLTLRVDGGVLQATLRWQASAKLDVREGFRIMYSPNTMPLFIEDYPGDGAYHTVQKMPADGYVWTDIPAGYYYFRVCQVVAGRCQLYSKDVIANISGKAK
ncbi:hypothetical protein HY933_01350 [Candidatus Falkowbacteria bacterium]|nr:hypothetical protein [Candidatus Falkowbacteria bacterium]